MEKIPQPAPGDKQGTEEPVAHVTYNLPPEAEQRTGLNSFTIALPTSLLGARLPQQDSPLSLEERLK
jgi:hypothetical protein